MAKKSVFCIATSDAQALRIVHALKVEGFAASDLSVLFPDREGIRDFGHEAHTKAPEGATAGVVTGGVLGGIAGWLAGIRSLASPRPGPFGCAGPIPAPPGG